MKGYELVSADSNREQEMENLIRLTFSSVKERGMQNGVPKQGHEYKERHGT